jgi:hypothetical protein
MADANANPNPNANPADGMVGDTQPAASTQPAPRKKLTVPPQ